MRGIVAVGLLTIATLPAFAQLYPSRPLRLIVPWPPSGAVDILARPIGQKLSENIAQSVVIDNRAGANGIIGSEVVAKAPADGYTFAIDNVTGHAINATLYGKMPFNSQRDFAHVSLLAWVANGISCLPSLPVKNVRELIALGKARPGQLSYASFGVGSSAHLAGELFKTMAGVDMLHVPYKGGLPAITDLLAGQVSLYFPVVPSVVQLTRAGRLRLLAITGAKRATALPETPTVNESGLPGFEATNWFGALAPAATPPDVVNKLNTELIKVLQTPDVRDRLLSLAYDLQSSTPQDFSALLKTETEKWAKIVKASGAKAD
ncbi:MAG TPA: tripartite tricarboxylate transporter substrate binding protein [Burkholderiales bacterium]|nr:tripartite tricarboxylate transporter substrate binding protein [Burkholderiales bacterium]